MAPGTSSGGCRCRRFRFRAHASPISVSYCHCGDCRRATGAPVTVFVGFMEQDVELLARAPAAHPPGAAVQRLFCPDCGTPVGYRDIALPGEIYFYLGIFDEPSQFRPGCHAWVSQRLAWLHIADDLPQHDRFSRQRDQA